MEIDRKGQSFPDCTPSSNSSCPPPSPPPPSPVRPISPPVSPSWPLPPSPKHSPVHPNLPRPLSPPISPSLSQISPSTRPLSPQLSSPTTAHPRASTSHSRRTSLQSISPLPPIREDANSIFSEVSHAGERRSRSSVYQYGEDYITAYERVGIMSSPGPRSPSRASTRSAKTLRKSTSVRSATSSKSRKSGHSVPSSVRSAWPQKGTPGAPGFVTGPYCGDREMGRDRDLEHGAVSEPESEAEKNVMRGAQARKPLWRRWRRFFIIVTVILGLAGLAVGIIFGTRSA